MTKMLDQINGHNFIEAFKNSMTELLSEIGESKLLELYNPNNLGRWTDFIKWQLCPRIAQHFLDLECESVEFLRIDLMMNKIGPDHFPVPFVAIESENKYDDGVEGETRKLCTINAPVKVLITRDDTWEIESRPSFFQGSDNEKYENENWSFAYSDFKYFGRMQGDLVVIIFYKRDILRFDSLLYNEVATGERI